MSLKDKIKKIGIQKAFFMFASAFTVAVIVAFVGYLVYEYVKLDTGKASRYLNSKFFGAILNLIVLFNTAFIFDSLYPGNTISTLMRIDSDSSPEDKRNATYIICTVFMAIAYVVSFQ